MSCREENPMSEYTDKNKRERGTIKHARLETADNGINTLWLSIEFPGSSQGFGGLALDDHRLAISFCHELCKAFDASGVRQLEGMACFALRCWGTNNDPIVGLESVDTGKRFTLVGWRRRQGFADPGELARQTEHLRNELAWAKRRAAELEHEIEVVAYGYTDWEQPR